MKPVAVETTEDEYDFGRFEHAGTIILPTDEHGEVKPPTFVKVGDVVYERR